MYTNFKREMAERGQELIEGMRESCLQKGCGGIKLLSVIFRHMDKDFSKRLTRSEFKQGVVAFGLTDLSDIDTEMLFQCFDKDDNDTIDFDEFFRRLRPPLKKSRESTVNNAFDQVDVNKDGVIQMDDLKVFYTANAKNHPKYLSGEWTLDQTLRSFLDSIDSPDDPDGVVTREEFLDYYAGVSATIDDDSYFVMMMRSCYGLPQR
ncbi:calcyphosin-like protein isoform X1 [Mytilus galloprovincialis]|uniref:EF-hand domain-containing protein n=2 Tax=Mytilus galloprovincialis TaxID=29158 RepID=A0A8B6CEB6_MYTGA|nr:Hypothetical predicted protein [Mytilus galloprovincialis]